MYEGDIVHDQSLFARQLEYFEVLYRMRSYSKAARAIPITYQGLRKAISKLEADLDVELFEAQESAYDLVPTPYGDLLYKTSMAWSKDMKNLYATIEQMKAEEVATVSLCSAIGSLATIGYHLIADFNAEHEALRIDSIDYSDEWVDLALINEEFGLGIVASPFDDELEVKPLKSIGCAMYVPRNHPLAAKTSLKIADLEGQNITLPEPHFKSHAFYRDKLKELNVHPRSILYCSDLLWSFEFAREGRGLGMCVEKGFGFPLEREEVALIPLEDGYTRTIGIAYRRGHLLTETERIVYDYIVENTRS